MTINARHRKHYKSGSCLSSIALGHSDLNLSVRFRRLMQIAAEKYRRTHLEAGESTEAILTRPEYFERARNPRTTQSMFGRVMSRVLGLFGRGKLAAA